MAEHHQTPVALTIAGSDSLRRRRHPGRPQDLHRARRLRRQRADGADRAEYARRIGHPAGAAGIRDAADRRRRQRPRDRARSRPACSTIAPRCWRWSKACAGIASVRSSSIRSWWRPAATCCCEPDAVEAVRRELLPLADIITPNLPEAARLLDRSPAADEAEMEAQAQALLALGPKAVLLKGGHGEGREAVDILVERGLAPVRLALPRIDTAQHARHGLHAIGRHRRRPGHRASRCRCRRRRQALRSRGSGGRPRAENRERIGSRRSSAYAAQRPETLSFWACRWVPCGAAAPSVSEYGLDHLRAARASVTNLGNAMPRHRFRAPGGASGRRLGAPPDLAEEPVRNFRAGFFLCRLHPLFPAVRASARTSRDGPGHCTRPLRHVAGHEA